MLFPIQTTTRETPVLLRRHLGDRPSGLMKLNTGQSSLASYPRSQLYDSGGGRWAFGTGRQFLKALKSGALCSAGFLGTVDRP